MILQWSCRVGGDPGRSGIRRANQPDRLAHRRNGALASSKAYNGTWLTNPAVTGSEILTACQGAAHAE